MNPDRLLRRFMRYVQCDSESGHEQAFCRLLEEEGAKLGIQFWRDPVGEQAGSDGWNLGASIPGTGTPVLFSCHMDTVAPGRGVQPVVEGGVVRSSGDTVLGADDKSGIAAVMEALESLLESGKPHRPVELLFSVCEELGLKGAKYADYSRFASKEALVLDNDIPGLINHRAPANVHLHIQVQGRAAHAAVSHGEGVHALKAAVAAIAQIPCGAPDADTVMNVANFLAPGPTNVVPAQASFDMEIRSFVEDKLQGYIQQVRQALETACGQYGASYTLEVERHSDVLDVPLDSPVLQQIQEIYRQMGVETRVESTFGGCDATWLCANGIRALNTGTGMANVHGTGETIAIKDLETTTRMVEALMAITQGCAYAFPAP